MKEKIKKVMISNVGKGMFRLDSLVSLNPGDKVNYEEKRARQLASIYPQLKIDQALIVEEPKEPPKEPPKEGQGSQEDQVIRAKRGRPKKDVSKMTHEANENQESYEKFESGLSKDSPVPVPV